MGSLELHQHKKDIMNSPLAIANIFIDKAHNSEPPEEITEVEVQKLIYFAHGCMLALHDEPLHSGEWEAWKNGPVLPEVHSKLAKYNGKNIHAKIKTIEKAVLTKEEHVIIDNVYNIYKPLGGQKLRDMTHMKNSPWDIVNRKWFRITIPNDLIQNYFERMV